LMRLAGLSAANYSVLVSCRLNERFPYYRTPTDAVMGYRPEQPR
jgi:hypothetical protein